VLLDLHDNPTTVLVGPMMITMLLVVPAGLKISTMICRAAVTVIVWLLMMSLICRVRGFVTHVKYLVTPISGNDLVGLRPFERAQIR